MYDLEVRLGQDLVTRRIGLRTVELVTDADAVGARFAFRVNGREIFMRGANWIPRRRAARAGHEGGCSRPPDLGGRIQHDHDPSLGRRAV